MATGIKTGGRTPGTPNKRTTASRRQLAGLADPLGFLAAVLNGETIDGAKPSLADRMAAARELRRVLVPDCRERTLTMTLPAVASAEDLPAAFSAMLAGVSAGEITPTEARALVDLLDGTRRAFETVDLAARITELEEHA